MTQENYTLDETDFEDALEEIAGEIEYLKSITKSEITHESHVSLKSEVEAKKAVSITHNLFQMLKTIQEVRVSSDQKQTPMNGSQVVITSKYIPSTLGKKHSPILITESPLTPRENIEYHPRSLEDLWEEESSEPLSKPIDTLKKDEPVTPTSEPPASAQIPQFTPKNRAEVNTPERSNQSQNIIQKPKILDVPSRISRDIGQHLRRSERDIFKNFMKTQKK